MPSPGITLHHKIHNLWPSLTHDAFEEGLCKPHRMDRVCLEPYQVPIILKINLQRKNRIKYL
jgi:hypothetical protein